MVKEIAKIAFVSQYKTINKLGHFQCTVAACRRMKKLVKPRPVTTKPTLAAKIALFFRNYIYFATNKTIMDMCSRFVNIKHFLSNILTNSLFNKKIVLKIFTIFLDIKGK